MENEISSIISVSGRTKYRLGEPEYDDTYSDGAVKWTCTAIREEKEFYRIYDEEGRLRRQVPISAFFASFKV